MATITAAPAYRTTTASLVKQRVTSIDFLRGLVMVIMALDHVRDYFHIEGMTGDPTDMATTTPILFFTRWITHYCAPTFVFLAGVSGFLAGQRRTKKELSLFLIKRGLWLVFVELFIVSLGWTFDPTYGSAILQVIWAIGMSMIVLGIFVWLPLPVILLTGLIIVFGHNSLDKAEAVHKGPLPFWWDVLHWSRFSAYPVFGNRVILFAYAFLPWTGVMFLGYCFGSLYRKEVDVSYRKKFLLALGLSAIISFVVLRIINGYGNPYPWTEQRNGTYTFLSFLNVHKYPPSLMYVLMTLGPAILFLAFFEHMQSKFAKFFITFGRVPFFYYILHLYLIHVLCVIAFYASGYGSNDIVTQSPFLFRPPQFGFGLPAVYGIWALTIAILYPLCRWFDRYKSTHSHWALSYL